MFIEKVTGDLGAKRRWRQYKAHVKALPAPYRTAVDALEHYLMYFGSVSNDMTIFEDLLELFERAAVDGTPVRTIVGDDPVAFIEQFKENYVEDGWVARQRKRLADAIDEAAAQQDGAS